MFSKVFIIAKDDPRSRVIRWQHCRSFSWMLSYLGLLDPCLGAVIYGFLLCAPSLPIAIISKCVWTITCAVTCSVWPEGHWYKTAFLLGVACAVKRGEQKQILLPGSLKSALWGCRWGADGIACLDEKSTTGNGSRQVGFARVKEASPSSVLTWFL